MSQYADHLFDENSSNNSWANMLRFIPRGARVLDVGCSTANFGAALQKMRDCVVVGIDISDEDIAEAQTKISAAYVRDITQPGSLEALGTFDVIIFADVLEHLVDPREALRACKALLSEGGYVVYSIPHMGHLSVRFQMLEGRFPYTELGLLDRTHLHFYDRHEVDDVFGSAGFSIVEEAPTVVGFPERLAARRLGSIGLADSPQFYEMLEATDAHIYQFIGRAVPTRDVPTLVPALSDDDASPDGLLRLANDALEENQQLRTRIRELETYLSDIKRRPLTLIARAIGRRVGLTGR